jgi:hypothetical protein
VSHPCQAASTITSLYPYGFRQQYYTTDTALIPYTALQFIRNIRRVKIRRALYSTMKPVRNTDYVEVFALQGRCEANIGSWLPTFRDNLSHLQGPNILRDPWRWDRYVVPKRRKPATDLWISLLWLLNPCWCRYVAPKLRCPIPYLRRTT